MIAACDDNADDGFAARKMQIITAYGYSESQDRKPFAYSNGIAFIPVTGLLINRCSWSWSFATGYNFIRNQLNAALLDEDVTGIVFDCDSGGGMVAGCFELCEDIYRSRSIKPSVAVVDAASYSACYAIASSASKIIVTPSGGVGSVGVVAMHADFSKMLDDAGIKITFIHSGTHKVDGNAYQPLKSSVKASIQKSLDSTREEFVALVARNRGLDTKVVFDTEAQCYGSTEALDLGLVDAIAPPIEAVTAFFDELSRSETKEITMSKAEKPGAESTATAPESATTDEQVTAQQTVDVGAERAAERQRIKSITTSEAAKDRPALANHLALNTELSVESALEILSAAAPEVKQEAQAGATAFEVAMATSTHPEVGAGTSSSEKTEMTAAQRILASQSVATGVKH